MLALVVDNSCLISQLVRSLLEELDVEVQTSDTVSDAMSLATQSRRDIICVSVPVKDGTGLDFARRCREGERRAYTPILLLTSDSDATSEHALITVGITRCFAKYDIPKLGDQLALFVEMQRGRSLAGRKLLYVENSASTALMTTRQLELMPLEVEHFTTASQALERFQQPSEFDVVIADVALYEAKRGGRNRVVARGKIQSVA